MRYKNSNRGFTTIEIAIVLIISGVILTMFLKAYTAYLTNKEYNETLYHLKQLDNSLNEYVQEFGRYPCPADPTLPPLHADYGLETNCGNFALQLLGGACAAGQRPLLQNTGTESNVICANNDARDIDSDGNDEMVLIGIIPFRTLSNAAANRNISDDFREYKTFDGYGMRFTYAVTETMADRGRSSDAGTGVTPQMGAIRVVDENGTDVTVPPRSAHYVIVSHGRNRRGAYMESGAQTQDCDFSTWIIPSGPNAGMPIGPVGLGDPNDPNLAGSGLSLEIENCDHEINPNPNMVDAIFRQAINSGNENDPNFFDDIVHYRNVYPTNIWQASRGSTGLAGQRFLYNTNIGNVGVGDAFDAPVSKLHVLGDFVISDDVTASGSEPLILSEEGYCGQERPGSGDNSECMQPAFIVGPETDCPNNGEVVTAISANDVVCEPLFLASPNLNFDCGFDTGDMDGDGDVAEPMFATGIVYNRVTNTVTPLGCQPVGMP